MKTATLGSISHGTLRSEDLLETFGKELEWQIQRNGEYFSKPENFTERDRLNNLACEALDCWLDDGETLDPAKEDLIAELINETLPDALQSFCAPYCFFGAHHGDGADFGFWLSDIEDIKEQVEFSSSKEQEEPGSTYRGEWLHVNERGNCALYVRGEIADADGNCKVNDCEIWSVV